MKLLILVLITIIPAVGSAKITDEVRMGRYSLVNTSGVAHQKSPLQVIVDTNIPRELDSIGESITYLLLRSGYQLADPKITSDKLANFYQLPVPEVHRELGPIKLLDALNILTGEAFIPVIDPVHRLVSFELDEKMVRMLGDDNE